MKRSHAFLLSALFILLIGIGPFFAGPQLPPPALVTASGYGGPMTLELSTSAQGAITGIRILTHHETASYVDGIQNFLRQFTGKTGRDPLVLGKDIDAISGATISSKAITSAVGGALRGASAKEPGHIHLRPVVISLSLLLVAVAALLTRNNALRWAALFGGFVYFGVIAHTMLSVIQFAHTGLRHIPLPADNTLWWMTLILGLGATLVIGRIYCGSLCPFALVQEILHQLMLRKRPAPDAISPATDQNARLIKYALLFLVVELSLIIGNTAPAAIEPFITLFSGHGSKLAWVFLALMLIMAVFDFRFWCKYLCPVGALSSLCAAFSIFKIVPTKACTHCGQCQKACPVKAIAADSKGIPAIDPQECIVCGKCLRACPANALTIKGCHDKEI